MGEITGNRVWEAFQQDPALNDALPKHLRAAVEPFVRTMPKVLREFSDLPLTLSTLYAARLAFLSHCVEHGLASKLAEATTLDEDHTDVFDSDTLELELALMLVVAIKRMVSVITDISGFLQAAGLTEKQVMLGPGVGLSKENAAAYVAGTLTIGDLLITQPTLILKWHDFVFED